jgi:hypothetical protein
VRTALFRSFHSALCNHNKFEFSNSLELDENEQNGKGKPKKAKVAKEACTARSIGQVGFLRGSWFIHVICGRRRG